MDLTAHAHRQSERLVLVALAAAALFAAALVGWLLQRNDSSTQPVVSAFGPVIVTSAQLAEASATLDRPIYWAGPRDRFAYELTTTDSGRIYVRYLPAGAAAGDSRANFLTVGTYPGDNAYTNLKKVSTGPAVHSNLLRDGGLLVAPKRLPKSAYIAFPDADYQVEVYDASTGAARRMALNGLIKPVR